MVHIETNTQSVAKTLNNNSHKSLVVTLCAAEYANCQLTVHQPLGSPYEGRSQCAKLVSGTNGPAKLGSFTVFGAHLTLSLVFGFGGFGGALRFNHALKLRHAH